MRLRARHLAGLFLLLATLGAAEGSTVRAGAQPIPTHCIQLLLAQRASQLRDAAPVDPTALQRLVVALTPSASLALRSAHPMAAAAGRAAATHAVTGRSL